MSDVIDELKVQIDASTKNADAKLDRFIDKMLQLQSTITGIKMSNASNIASGLNQITSSVQNFKNNTKTADFTRIATGLNKLSAVDSWSISVLAKSMSEFLSSMTGIDRVHFDSQSFDALTGSVAKLGRSSITEAAQNLEFLKTSLSDFVTSMNTVGQVTFNADGLVSMVNSISRLGSANAVQAVALLPQISAHLRDFILTMNSVGSVTFDFIGLGNLISGITRLGGAKATQAATNLKPIKDQLLKFVSGLNGIGKLSFDTTSLANLVSSITKLGGKAASNAIPNIQNLGVALNQLMTTLSKTPVVSQNLIQMTTALASLAGAGSKVGSATAAMNQGFNLFPAGSKKIKSSSMSIASAIGRVYATYWMLFRAMGMFRKAMDISSDLTEVQNVVDQTFGNMRKKIEDFSKVSLSQFGMSALTAKDIASRYQAMGVAMGFSQKRMSDMSISLTKLAADMASFYNVEQKDVAKSLEAVFTGQTMPLRKYGIDLTQATLKEWALNNGLNANIKSMSAAQKMWLRYQYVMANSQQVMGDFARTSDSWHNQLVLLAGAFQSLGSTIGGSLINALKPFVRALNSVMLKVIQFAEVVSNALGAIFGWKYESGGGIADDFADAADSADDLAGGTGDAAKNTKKMADNLQSFDKLNVISSQKDSGGSGSGSGASGGAGSAGDGGKWVETDSLWKKYTSSIDSLYKLGEYIGDVLTKTLDNIDWDKIYKGAENFGSGLASFLNGLISPELFGAVGRTIANSLNTVLHGLDSFGETFNWINFGNSIAAGINGLFLNFDFNLMVDTFNVWAVGILNTIAAAIEGVEWAEIARRVADALKRVDWEGLLEGVGKVFWASFGAAVDVTSELLGIDKKTASRFVEAIGSVVLAIKGFDTISKAIGNVNKLHPALGNLFRVVAPVKYVAIAAGIGGLVLALDQFGVIDVDWNTLGKALKNIASVLAKFTIGIGKGLISFIEDITPIVGPVLEGAINGTAKALDALASVLNKIPESVISGVTEVLLGFFAIWKTTEFIGKMSETVTHLINMKDAFRMLAGLQIGGIKETIAGLFTSLAAHPYAAIAIGIGLIAAKIMSLTKEAANNSAIGQFSQAIHELNDEVSSKTDQINSNLESTRNAIETAGTGEVQVARDLAREYEALANKTNLTTADKERLKDVSEQLVGIIPDLSQYINDETGYLDVQAETLDTLISGYESLAQKQAAQELLVQAYKDQYEAQMNVNNALGSYNKAFNDYLTDAGLAPDIIKQIRDNQLDLNEARREFENSPNAFKEKYGVNDYAELKVAINGLNKEMGGFYQTLTDAQQAQVDANNNIDTMKKVIDEADAKIKESEKAKLADKMATNEYQQALSDLNTEFQNMDLSLSDDFMQNLALKDGFDATGLREFFDSLSGGVAASSDSIQSAFTELGMKLPVNLADALAQKEPETQAAMVKILMGIQSGIETNSADLKLLFENLGYDLPDAFSEKLAEKEASVQTNTLNLLAKIQEGYSLTEGNLKKLFEGLGEEIPEKLIGSLAGKEADVQAQAIELLGQIPSASEQERSEIIANLEQLGVDGADSLKSGIDSKKDDVKKSSDDLISSVKESSSSEEIQKAFEELGLSIPISLANALESATPEAQSAAINVLTRMQNDVQANSASLKKVFEALGHELPDTLAQKLAEKESSVQTNTINLLAKVDDGYRLKEKDLIELFSGLGNNLPEELIKGLSDSSVKANVQAEAINLLNQIPEASDQKRNEIIDSLKQLGIDGADGLKSGLYSGQSDVENQVESVIDSIPYYANKKKDEVNDAMNNLGADADESLKNGIANGESSVNIQADELTQRLIDTVNQQSDNVESTFNSLGISGADKLREGIGNKKDDVAAATRDLVSVVTDSASSEFSNTTSGAMYDTGVNIARGVSNGMDATKEELRSPIQAFFDAIKKSFADIFDMHSPAKNMEPYGQNILRGVIEGYRSSFGEWTGAMNEWYDKYISPWFTEQRWTNLYSTMKTSLKSVWDKAVTQWSQDVSTWWTSDVEPWFTAEKWSKGMSGIKAGFENAFNEALDAVKQIWGGSSTWLNGDIDFHIDLGNLDDAVVAMKNAADSINLSWDSVIKSFQSIPKKLQSAWDDTTKATTNAVNFFIDYANKIPSNVENIATRIQNNFSQLAGNIEPGLNSAANTISLWTTNISNVLDQNVPKTIENVRARFSEVPEKIEKAISGAIEEISAWGDLVYSTFDVNVNDSITAVTGWFSEMPGEIYDEIIKIEGEIQKWRSNAIGFFEAEVPKICSKVVELFSGLPDSLVPIGENVTKGLWRGINNLTDWLGTNITGFVNGVIKKFEDGFDEHSPSKIAFHIGDFFTIGLWNGLEDKFDNVYSSVSDFTDKISDIDLTPSFVDPEVKINRDFIDNISTQQSFSFEPATVDLSSGVTAEVNAALSGIIDYNKLGDAVYRAQSRAMQENPTTISDDDVFNAARRAQKKYYKRTNNPGFAF